MTIHRIVSGEIPTVGMRVITNDLEWGTIVEVEDIGKCGVYCESWHTVMTDKGKRGIYNCDRLTTKMPR